LHLCSYLRSAQILYINSQTSCLHPRGNLSLSFPWRRGMVGSNLAFLPSSSIPSPEVLLYQYQYQILGFRLSYLTRFPCILHRCRLASSFPFRQSLRNMHARIIDTLCSVTNTGLLHPFLLYHNAKLSMRMHVSIQPSQSIDARTPGTWTLRA
jgi:hypothetical protein